MNKFLKTARGIFIKRKVVQVLYFFKTTSKRPRKKKEGVFEKFLNTVCSFFPIGLSTKEQTFFAKRLSFLIRANIPLLESLEMLRQQTKSRGYKYVLDSVIDDVSNGQYLSKSLGKFQKTFGVFTINIIKIGESSGILSQNLDYLADELKKKQSLRRKVIGAFVYPTLITLATLGITIFLMVYLFPKITPIFGSLHVELPLSTRIVIFLSDLLRDNGLFIFLGLIVLIFGFTLLLKQSRGVRILFEKWIMEIPLIGNVIKFYNLANSTRTLGLLLQGGVTLSRALPITADTTKNLMYKEEFYTLGLSVNRGEKISVRLDKRRDLFPDVLSQMIAVGEKSGSLSDTLVYLSEMYESEVDDFTKNLSSLIEPVLMIFMGILVGFIAISIITPIYGISQNLHG